MSVLAFIILGSIIRQINLLVLLSGLMIAPFFFNWRISMKMLERVRASRRLPDWSYAATPFLVRWDVANDRTRTPTWGLRVTDQVKLRDAEPKSMEPVMILVPAIPAGGSRMASYRCLLPERGIYEFGPAEASSAFPVGLIRSKIKIRQPQPLIVAPCPGRLTKSWVPLIQSRHEGETRKQRQRSDSQGEFHGLRPWASGDNPRQVHWRSSAKQGDLMVRQYEQETDQPLLLILDLAETLLARTDVEQTLSFVTTILRRYGNGRSRLSMGLFGDQQLVCPRLGRPTMVDAMRCLATIQPAVENGLQAGLHQLQRETSQLGRTRTVVISTRSRQQAAASHDLGGLSGHWIDVSNGESLRYFLPDQGVSQQALRQWVAAGAGGTR